METMKAVSRNFVSKNTWARKVIAVMASTALVASMTGGSLVSQAFADDPVAEEGVETPAEPSAPEPVQADDIHGIDFMTVNAEGGWDLFRVDNGVGKTIYIELKQDGKVIAPRFSYVIDGADATEGDTSSDRIAHIVALKIAATSPAQAGESAAPQTVQQVYGNQNNFPSYTVKVYAAKRGGKALYEGSIYPVYAKLQNADGTADWKLLGIRTKGSADAYANTIGAGATYYKNLTDGNPIAYQCVSESGEPVVTEATNEQSKTYLEVPYQQVEADAISGAVKYVDENGNIVDTEVVENIGAGKDVTIKKSFFASVNQTDENGNVVKDDAGNPVKVTNYYRVIQRLNGTTVTLTPEQSTKQIRVMQVDNAAANAYQVTIKYVDEQNNLLWSDSVDVKGEGYQYTLPNTFSVSAAMAAEAAAATDRSNASWGVNYYILDSWTMETNASDENQAINARNAETAEGNPVVKFEPGSYPAGRTVTAKYLSQETTKSVNLTVVEINGETGALIDKVQYTVTPDQSATYTPAKKNGLVPWSGNMDPITYAWEDLQKGTDVMQYVYYVPEDYVPGDAYDITVQYMNIANSEILRSETITIDPEANDWVNILGEETFAQGDDTYVRLAGQETAIRHGYFTPARTYTIYYRDVNDKLNAQVVIRRTQIVDTERVVTVPGTTVMTAAPVAAAPATPAAPAEGATETGTIPTPTAIDAGVGAGDGQTIINDDDNPLANLNGQDTSTERTIVDDENPLYSGLAQDVEASGAGMTIGVATGVAVLLAAGVALWWWTRRRKKEDLAAEDGMNL